MGVETYMRSKFPVSIPILLPNLSGRYAIQVSVEMCGKIERDRSYQQEYTRCLIRSSAHNVDRHMGDNLQQGATVVRA